MRRIICIGIIFALTILVAGCTQTTSPPATPLPTPVIAPVPEDTVMTTATTPAAPQIDLTIGQTGSDIFVKYQGGPDAGNLAALVISVNSFNYQSKTEREDNPVIGQQYIFPQMGTADPDLVKVVGVFRDGTQLVLSEKKV